MAETNGKRRVVITGQGVVTPLGIGVDTFWAALKQGKCGYGPATTYDTEGLTVKISGEVKDFDTNTHLPNNIAQVRRADKMTQYSYACAHQAVTQAGLETPLKDGARASAIIGVGSPGLTTLENAYRELFAEGKRRPNPLTLLSSLGSTVPATLSMAYQITGPTFCVVSACSSAAHAMGLTYRMIRDGVVDLGLTGGAEASLNWGATKAWEALFVLSRKGCFPFSKQRDGTVLSEGAGVFVFEELEHARARGANILAEVMGFGMTADAGGMVNPTVEGPAGAMQEALDEARLSPSDIDYLNAHGTATKVNDPNETNAIKRVFGNAANNLSISSTKSMHGHLLGGGAAVEAVACIKAMEDNFVPPTINLNEPDPECDLDFTPNQGKSREITYTMSNSLAFGGLNTVLIFGPAPV